MTCTERGGEGNRVKLRRNYSRHGHSYYNYYYYYFYYYPHTYTPRPLYPYILAMAIDFLTKRRSFSTKS
eukprot:13907022-Heterocapsa_arctica.AAC.1